MADLRLETPLSIEEIEENFKDFDLFSSMEEGFEAALAHHRGEEVPGLVVHDRTLPDVDTVEIRESLSLTRPAFAAVLGVSRGAVESWEAGESTPPLIAQKLLYLIQEDHSLVQKLQQI